MRYIDISRTIESGMPKYPSDPVVKVSRFKSLKEGNSCNLSKLDFGSHAGTHIDAPLHILEKGKGVDGLKVKDLICRVLVASTYSFYEKIKKSGIKGVLFKGTGNRGTITLEQSEMLLKRGIKLIGTESMSIEEPSDKTHPVHRLLLSKGTVIIEGLDLKRVKPGYYKLVCLPLKIKNGDGAPARAVLIYD